MKKIQQLKHWLNYMLMYIIYQNLQKNVECLLNVLAITILLLHQTEVLQILSKYVILMLYSEYLILYNFIVFIS